MERKQVWANIGHHFTALRDVGVIANLYHILGLVNEIHF